jgi:hypothetical protein
MNRIQAKNTEREEAERETDKHYKHKQLVWIEEWKD